MSVHVTSILTSQLMVLLSAGMISGIYFFRKSAVSRKEVFLFLGCNFLLLARGLIPVEFSFTHTIACRKILPDISRLFTYSIQIHETTVLIWQILLLLWLSGAVLRTSVFLLRYHRFQKLLRHMPDSKKAADYQRILHSMSKADKKETPFRIIVSDSFGAPMITGLIRPVILLPDLDFTDGELQYIFNHETNHFYYHDLWLLFAVELITCIYWWNPLFYYIKNCIRSGLELRNDYSIAGKLNAQERLQYLECILKIKKSCEKAGTKRFSLNLCLDANDRLVQTRYEILLNAVTPKQAFSRMYPVIIALILASFFVILEPSSPPENAPDSFSKNFNKIYLVKNKDVYDVYVDDRYQGQITKLIHDFKDLPIYDSMEDVPK